MTTYHFNLITVTDAQVGDKIKITFPKDVDPQGTISCEGESVVLEKDLACTYDVKTREATINLKFSKEKTTGRRLRNLYPF